MIETLNQDERKFYDLCRVEKPNMEAVIAIGKTLGATIKQTGAGLPSRKTLPERLEAIFKEARKNIVTSLTPKGVYHFKGAVPANTKNFGPEKYLFEEGQVPAGATLLFEGELPVADEPDEETIDAKEAIKNFRAGDPRVHISIEITCSLTEFINHFKQV